MSACAFLLYIASIFIFLFLFTQCSEVNKAGCHLVTEVAKEFGCYVGFPVSGTTAYELNLGKDKVQEEFQRQLDAFDGFDCDLLVAEVKIFNVNLDSRALFLLNKRDC